MNISEQQKLEEDEWCHLDFYWSHDEEYLQCKDDLTQEQLDQCQNTYESGKLLDGETLDRGDDCSYPIQNSRLSRSDSMKLGMLAMAANFLPQSYCANYRNPLTGRLDTSVDNSLSQEQQAIKIAKAEAKRLRKQNKKGTK